MSFGEAISSGFANYATFSGRSRRSAYWWWILFTAIVYLVAFLLDMMLGTGIKAGGYDSAGWITLLAWVALVIPTIAVTFRRLHDSGHSGWWWLLGLICGIGAIIVFVMCLQDSKPDNEYGPNPKGATA
jgi:uncharacterized membrane protein YhaH (DUF805 family)